MELKFDRTDGTLINDKTTVNITDTGLEYIDRNNNSNYFRPSINKTEKMAYLSDIDNAIQQAILDSWEASY